jgi:hypothetical protein
MLLLAVFEFAMNDLIFAANRYDVAKDRLAASFEDTRAAHRFRFSRHIAALARWLRWDDLRASASAVLIGAEDKSVADDDRQSVLWLVSDWEPEERMPVGRMGQDFWSKLDQPVLEETPLTVRHLVEWFRYDHSKRLRQTLENLLRDEELPDQGHAIQSRSGQASAPFEEGRRTQHGSHGAGRTGDQRQGRNESGNHPATAFSSSAIGKSGYRRMRPWTGTG